MTDDPTAFMESLRLIRQEARLKAWRRQMGLEQGRAGLERLLQAMDEPTWDAVATKVADPATGDCLERLREAVWLLALEVWDEPLNIHSPRYERLRELLGEGEVTQ